MKKKNKIIISIIICIIILLIGFFVHTSFAIGDIDPNSYLPSDAGTQGFDRLSHKVGYVLAFIRNLSAVVSVIALMIIGVRYILGSLEEKAEYKKTFMKYVIGCVLAVSTTTFVSFIYNMVGD